MLNISVLASGGGTNFQAIIDAIETGKIENARINLLIASNDKAFAIKRAEKAGIKTAVIGNAQVSSEKEKSRKIIEALDDAKTDLVVLAGYMSILSEEIIEKYKNRIINIHPSLIPKYCGMGMYGIHVHEAVLAAGEKETGATVHHVDEGVDTGMIIMQEKVEVKTGDTPEILQKRVLETEHRILPEVVKMYAEGILGAQSKN